MESPPPPAVRTAVGCRTDPFLKKIARESLDLDVIKVFILYSFRQNLTLYLADGRQLTLRRRSTAASLVLLCLRCSFPVSRSQFREDWYPVSQSSRNYYSYIRIYVMCTNRIIRAQQQQYVVLNPVQHQHRLLQFGLRMYEYSMYKYVQNFCATISSDTNQYWHYYFHFPI